MPTHSSNNSVRFQQLGFFNSDFAPAGDEDCRETHAIVKGYVRFYVLCRGAKDEHRHRAMPVTGGLASKWNPVV
jgi:hypothetical protein